MFEAVHRPRRIITAATPVAVPLDTATVLQQQRFQRELSATPREGRVIPPMRRERPPMPSPKAAPRNAPPQREPREEPAAQTRGGAPFPTAAATPQNSSAQANANASAAAAASKAGGTRRAAVPRAVLTRAAQAPELPQRRDLLADPEAWKHAGLPKPAPGDWDLDLARRVIQLCKRASPSFHSWTVTVPLDPTVLPDTELAMAMLPSRLALRFKTQSPYSMALIRRHEDRLVSLLAQALPARQVDVELS
jgi:type III secretion control protein HpaP